MNENGDFLVWFSCKCGLKNKPVRVRFRREGEDIRDYFEKHITRRITQSHMAASPECRSRKLSELLIPANPDGVGVNSPGFTYPDKPPETPYGTPPKSLPDDSAHDGPNSG